VEKVKGEFAKTFEGLSKKEDCQRDKEEVMRDGNSLRNLVKEMSIAIDGLH
jgi:hypothetical protein